MADHRAIPMTPNPVYADLCEVQKEKEANAVSKEVVNSRQISWRKNGARNVMIYFVLPLSLLVLLCLVVALLVVTVAPSQPLPSSSSQLVPSSCADIIKYSPLSVSGYYVVRSSSGSLVQVYCDMGGVICDGSRGWMTVVPEYSWSSSFRNSTCNTVESFSTLEIQYSRVCGLLMGYTSTNFQYYSSEVCVMPPFNPQAGIDDSYVAGFSITHGRPRQHIWSLASSYEEGDWCPAFDGSKNPPQFVGKDYLLGSCYLSYYYLSYYYYSCSFNSKLWFIVNVTEPVSDNIELRACSGFYDDNITNIYFNINNLMMFVQ